MLFRMKLSLIYFLILGVTNTISKSPPTPNEIIRFECLTPRKIHGCEKTGYGKDSVYYYFFSRQNPDDPEFLHDCGRKFPENTNFNPKLPTIFGIHAYIEGICHTRWWRDIKYELLKRCDCNVFLVDWSFYTVGDYANAVAGIVPVSYDIAEMIDYIKAQGVDHSQIHLMSLSLGVQLLGLIGQKTRIGRITGMDPAGPPFHDRPNDEKLDRHDADYVDIMHVNSGRCIPSLGYLYPLGDEDFYVGDGEHQFNCYKTAIEHLLQGDIFYGIASLLIPTLCYHTQSMFYFTASINPKGCYFVGKRCENYQDAMEQFRCNKTCGGDGSECSVMGMDWRATYPKKLKEQRVYNVQVKYSCPFCKEEESKLISGRVEENKKKCNECGC